MPDSLMVSPTSALKRTFTESNGHFGNQISYSVSQILVLFAKSLWFLLLVALLALSIVVWLWVISFRSGWRLWTWAQERNNDQISVGLFYGLTVLLISPFFLFVDWAQKYFAKVIPDWMKLPAQVPVRQLFEHRLGISLGDEFPFFHESGEEAQTTSKPSAK